MFLRYFSIFFFCFQYAAAQPFYTRIRGGFGVDLYGITPRGAITAEAAFGYSNRSFWNVQAGLGAVSRANFRSPALSAALTHCVILNPYKRNPCFPQLRHYLIETYFEGGLGCFMVDRYDNGIYLGTNRQRLLTPSGIIGFRFNMLTGKWIYILRLRYTPHLLPNDLASYVGVGVGIGWR
ncbi:hypothetical protein [Dyadobacter sp. CY323]|uniref:hypothetical protein n=1 Tax=Dyadobacter sp. CY323 TaxID=2907302 RepID=UPI001F32A15F|nr:hypothetical protein [Dyadobacter sp. CY323]MCE6991503.1 hypothetical protein [Dyadobacter sp. CY323]